MNYFPGLVMNHYSAYLSLPSSRDYRHEPQAPSLVSKFEALLAPLQLAHC
jgi:hypothetical protein